MDQLDESEYEEVEDFGQIAMHLSQIFGEAETSEQCELLKTIEMNFKSSTMRLMEEQSDPCESEPVIEEFEESVDPEIATDRQPESEIIDDDGDDHIPLQPRECAQFRRSDLQQQIETVQPPIKNLFSRQQPVQQNRKVERVLEIHRQYQELKEGWLYKKAAGLIGSFEKRYFTLTNSKLFYFNTEKRQKVRGVINFRVARCEVQLQKDKHFSIFIEQYKNPYILRAVSQTDAEEWVDILSSVIRSNAYKQNAWIKTVNFKDYIEADSLTEEEFLDYSETGDILLFQTDNFGAKLQRGLTGSKYDHVGMVVKFENQELRVFDSNGDCGVGLLPWYQFVSTNDLYTKMTLRKLIYDRKHEIEPKIFQFVGQSLGKKYVLSFQKLIKRQSIPRNSKSKDQKEDDGYFCSELIAKTLKRCDLLEQLRSCTQYWPVDFSAERNIKLLKGAKLSDEITIILRKHRYV